MKLETYINALCLSRGSGDPKHFNPRRFRQFNKFFDRILRMDAEKDEEIRFLNLVIDKCEVDIKRLENQDDSNNH